ncbi:MAG: NAD(P)/FAD-dependent oxidoreductase [Burkholderiales bacterium]
MKAVGAATEQRHCDIAVIGGGPAGSTAAALLAERGFRVALFEKSRHPRFHIGESLLPANLPLFERLGVADEVRAIGMQKWGAELVSPAHAQPARLAFTEAWDKSLPYAYQVRRSRFDEILFRNAARKGALALEGCRVRGVEFAGDGGARLQVQREGGGEELWRARFVADASGRDTFLGNRLGAKRRSARHNSAAIYAHFRGARRRQGKREGDIAIFWFEHGWFWFIPLADGVTSIGAVVWPYYMKARAKPVNEFLMDTIALCPKLAERLESAERVTDAEATGNYSYACDRTHGPGYLLLGDAYAFIDPVFSTGVMLAMTSAVEGADAIEACLRRPREAARALARFDRRVRRGPRAFSWFIFRVTSPAMRGLLMAPHNTLRMKEALLSLLAGDVFARSPIGPSLLAFKGLYYFLSLADPWVALRAWRRRRNGLREVANAGA